MTWIYISQSGWTDGQYRILGLLFPKFLWKNVTQIIRVIESEPIKQLDLNTTQNNVCHLNPDQLFQLLWKLQCRPSHSCRLRNQKVTTCILLYWHERPDESVWYFYRTTGRNLKPKWNMHQKSGICLPESQNFSTTYKMRAKGLGSRISL